MIDRIMVGFVECSTYCAPAEYVHFSPELIDESVVVGRGLASKFPRLYPLRAGHRNFLTQNRHAHLHISSAPFRAKVGRPRTVCGNYVALHLPLDAPCLGKIFLYQKNGKESMNKSLFESFCGSIGPAFRAGVKVLIAVLAATWLTQP